MKGESRIQNICFWILCRCSAITNPRQKKTLDKLTLGMTNARQTSPHYKYELGNLDFVYTVRYSYSNVFCLQCLHFLFVYWMSMVCLAIVDLSSTLTWKAHSTKLTHHYSLALTHYYVWGAHYIPNTSLKHIYSTLNRFYMQIFSNLGI